MSRPRESKATSFAAIVSLVAAASLLIIVVVLRMPGLVPWLDRSPPPPAPMGSRVGAPESLLPYCNELQDSDHRELGQRPLRNLKAQLASVQDSPEDVPPETVAEAHVLLARELLAQAEIGSLFEHYASARRLLGVANLSEQEALEKLVVVDFDEAVARLRLAATVNHVQHGSGSTGLLFKGAEGQYADPEQALAAIQLLEAALTRAAGYLPALWLYNVAHMAAGTYPDGVAEEWLIPPVTFEPEGDAPRFVDVAREAGVANVSLLGGSIVEDFDNDGLLDIFATNYDPCAAPAYYHNDGDGTFSDRSESAGLADQLGGYNAVQADYDNDGLIDIYILRGAWQADFGRHRNSLLRNDGDGTFSDVTHAAGLAEVAYPSQSAAWADYDSDGDLDLYVGNEISSSGAAYPSQLFKNDGDGTFSDVAAAAGVANGRVAKGVSWGDYDNDGDPDLYVSNIGPNRLYRNEGDGTFTDVAAELRVDQPDDRSVTTWFWDYDNDGWLDIYVAGYGTTLGDLALDYLRREGVGILPKLYHNTGRGRFNDVTAEMDIDDVRLPMGANFGDVDNDGWLDFYLGTGDPHISTMVPNVLYRSDRGGRFLDVTAAAGVDHVPKGNGVAFGDLDNDGDQDIYVQAGGFHPSDTDGNALFLNPGAGNHWLTVRLVGVESNRDAIGARLKLTVDDGGSRRDIHAHVGSGGSYGASSLQQEIGLGGATRVDELEVFWPTSGRRDVYSDIGADQVIEITEGDEDYRTLDRPRVPLGRGGG